MKRKAYGWQNGGKWLLSLFKREEGRPANQYDTQNEVVREAESRGLSVEWLQ